MWRQQSRYRIVHEPVHPTPEYTAAPSNAYLYADGGNSFSLLSWQVNWRSVWKKLGANGRRITSRPQA